VTTHALKALVAAGLLLLLPACNWPGGAPTRTAPLDSTFVSVVESATDAESFLVDDTLAVNYQSEDGGGPPFDYVELLGGPKGFYAYARGPAPTPSQLDKARDLLADLRHYSDEHLLCLFTPSMALRLNSPEGSIVVFLCTDCRMFYALDEQGERLDGGTIKVRAAKRLGRLMESVFESDG